MSDDNEAGYGLLISDQRILASVDVVAEALGIPANLQTIPDQPVRLDFPFVSPGTIFKAQVLSLLQVSTNVENGEAQKMALLELKGQAPTKHKTDSLVRPPSGTHYGAVVGAIRDGKLIPFFGAGANLCDRPEKTKWQRGRFLPSGSELSDYLARWVEYPLPDTHDLVRVSQYVALMRGLGPLNDRLRDVFSDDYPPTSLHQFFARLPRILREKGYPPYRLIVTTNYDDVLERAFQAENEPFDLITYLAAGGEGERGRFFHRRPDGTSGVIDKPNSYLLPLDNEFRTHLQRSVILKIHGAIDRVITTAEPDDESDTRTRDKTEQPTSGYVITEDDFIDYMTRSDISDLLPITLAGKLKNSNFLFLGYRLRDWNLRVILHRIWAEQKKKKANYQSWAVQLNPEELEQKYWSKQDLDIFNVRLEDYIAELDRRITNLPDKGDL